MVSGADNSLAPVFKAFEGINASRSGEKLKKGTFLEKKGGYFKLSGENILTSILSAFHPFLTLPNETLKREKGTFFSV